MDFRERYAWELWWKAQRAIVAECDAKLELNRRRGDPEVEAFHTARVANFAAAKDVAIRAYERARAALSPSPGDTK